MKGSRIPYSSFLQTGRVPHSMCIYRRTLCARSAGRWEIKGKSDEDGWGWGWCHPSRISPVGAVRQQEMLASEALHTLPLTHEGAQIVANGFPSTTAP